MKQSLAIATFIILMGSGCRVGEVMQETHRLATQSQDWGDPTPKDTTLLPINMEAKLRLLLRDQVEYDSVPGMTLYVATSDGVWMRSRGQANGEKKVMMKPTDRFRIGTLTEMFVAVLCLQLAEEGQIDLDAPIVNYLPAEVSDRIPARDTITPRQLLTHTSGLASVNQEEFQAAVQAAPTYSWTIPDMLDYVNLTEPPAARGTFSYANTNYLLLELILADITDSSLATLLQQRIADPIDLTNTFLELRQPIPGGFTQGYADVDGDGSLNNVTTPLLNQGLGFGDKGIISNAPDLAKFFRALFTEETLLYPSTLEQLLTTTSTGMGKGQGLGIAHFNTRWGEAWGRTGRTTGFQYAALYFPVHDLTLIVWANTGDSQIDLKEVIEAELTIILGEPY